MMDKLDRRTSNSQLDSINGLINFTCILQDNYSYENPESAHQRMLVDLQVTLRHQKYSEKLTSTSVSAYHLFRERKGGFNEVCFFLKNTFAVRYDRLRKSFAILISVSLKSNVWILNIVTM